MTGPAAGVVLPLGRGSQVVERDDVVRRSIALSCPRTPSPYAGLLPLDQMTPRTLRSGTIRRGPDCLQPASNFAESRRRPVWEKCASIEAACLQLARPLHQNVPSRWPPPSTCSMRTRPLRRRFGPRSRATAARLLFPLKGKHLPVRSNAPRPQRVLCSRTSVQDSDNVVSARPLDSRVGR